MSDVWKEQMNDGISEKGSCCFRRSAFRRGLQAALGSRP